MKILLLDAFGATGHVVNKYLENMNYDVKSIHISRLLDSVTKKAEKPFYFIEELLENSDFDAIINFARIINEVAEEQSINAIMINSYLPKYLEEITSSTRVKVIHLSTDCVFSGENGPYYEDDIVDGKSYYALSKYLGEINNNKDLTIRSSIIGPENNPIGSRLFNWFMLQKSLVYGYSNVYWNGITSVELSKILVQLLEKDISGIIHIGAERISKYDLLKKFNKYFKNDEIEIVESTETINNKVLLSNKLFDLSISTSYDVMMQEMVQWVEENIDIYQHYKK